MIGVRWRIGLLGCALAACQGDESISGFVATGTVFRLVELNGAPFDGRATLVIDGRGRVSGVAPCGRFSAAQTAPYPWFALGPIDTIPDCGDANAEMPYLDALGRAAIAEVSGDVLILSNTDGLRMVFQVGN